MAGVVASELGKPLIVLSAPSKTDAHYKKEFLDLIRFDILFAKLIIGKDNVVVLADKTTVPYLTGGHPELIHDSLPKDVIIESDVQDIWIRDFGTVKQRNPIKFVFQPQYLNKRDSKSIDNSFLQFLNKHRIRTDNTGKHSETLRIPLHDLIVDGGNVVDNGIDKAILTTRVLDDNKNVSDVKRALQAALGYETVLLITQYGDVKEEATGHSDGMVSFIDDNVLAIGQLEEPKQERLLQELRDCFGDTIKIVTVPNFYDNEKYRGFCSACGLHVNCLVTEEFVYMPTFGSDPNSQRRGHTEEGDQTAFRLITENTRKTVVPVPVPYNVARLGGTVRCLSMQVQGPLADHLLRIGQNRRFYLNS